MSIFICGVLIATVLGSCSDGWVILSGLLFINPIPMKREGGCYVRRNVGGRKGEKMTLQAKGGNLCVGRMFVVHIMH